MARIRTLKPEIWMSPQVMNLGYDARLLFIGLITQADDEGRGTADSRRLKAAIFGGDDETSSNVRRMLDDIDKQGLATIYDVQGHGLLYQLSGWRSHQKIDRAKRSAYPPPDSPDARRSIVESSTTDRRGSDRTVPEGKGSEGIVSTRIDESSNPSSVVGSGRDSAPRETLSAEFEQFLHATYPAGNPKADLNAAWHWAMGLVGTGKATEADLRRRVQGYRDWVDTGGVSGPQFVELPQRWFNPNQPNPSWAQEWAAVPSKGQQRTEKTLAAAQHLLEHGSNL